MEELLAKCSQEAELRLQIVQRELADAQAAAAAGERQGTLLRETLETEINDLKKVCMARLFGTESGEIESESFQ